jgi:hypothetical protein
MGLVYSQDGSGMSIVRLVQSVPHDSTVEERWGWEGSELANV